MPRMHEDIEILRTECRSGHRKPAISKADDGAWNAYRGAWRSPADRQFLTGHTREKTACRQCRTRVDRSVELVAVEE